MTRTCTRSRRQCAERHRPQLQVLDEQVPRDDGGPVGRRPGGAARCPSNADIERAGREARGDSSTPPRRREARACRRAPSASWALDEDMMSLTDTRRPHRLHALRQARALSARHAGAAGGARRSASISIRSAAGGPSAGAARSMSAKASSPSTASSRAVRSSLGLLQGRASATTKMRGLAAGRRLSCQTQLLGDVVIDVPPERQVHKQVVRKRAERATSRSIRRRGSTSSRSRSPTCTSPPPISSASIAALDEQWEIDGPHLRSRASSRDLQKALRKGEWKITAPSIRALAGGGNRLVAIWPGFHDKAIRPRRRRRLDHDRRASQQSRHRRCGGLGRPDEPADPLRRRSDEPRLLCDDESRRREGNDRRHPRGAQHARRAGRRPKPESSSRDILEIVLVGNPVMHHLFLGIDPTELGGAPFALATGLADHLPGPRARSQAQSRRLCLCAALHRRPCRRRYGGRGAVGSAA